MIHSIEFDYKRDAKYLSKFLRQCETAHTLDLDFLLQYFAPYNCEQRMGIIGDLAYEYNYQLDDMILERPESPLRSCALALMIEPIELYARDFHDLLLGKRTQKISEDISRQLLEILLALNNADTRKFKDLYKHLFESTIEKDVECVQGRTSIISKLLIELLRGERHEEPNSSTEIARAIAKKLYEAGEGTPGIDYETFIRIFTRDAFSQLSTIFDIYEDLYKRPIEEAIEREFPNPIEMECFQDIVDFTRSPAIYYAKILREALGKPSIDCITLTRIIVGHEERDFQEIKLEYSKIFDETLDQTIHTHLDIPEIKRFFITIINKGEAHPLHDDEHASGTTSTDGMRRNLSHDAIDKVIHVFKAMRPH